jgi:hypothetical protein
MQNIKDWVTPHEVVYWARANLGITHPNDSMTRADIRRAIRWIGMCSVDTIYIDNDKPVFGRIGIGLMLTVTLMVFPEYYAHYELWQRN